MYPSSGTRDRDLHREVEIRLDGVYEAQRLKSLEDENRRLEHRVLDLSLDKEVRAKTVGPIHEIGCGDRHRVVSDDQTLGVQAFLGIRSQQLSL